MPGFATPVPSWTAIVAAVSEDDPVWALKLVLQCRDHLREALQSSSGADSGPVSGQAWTRDPAVEAARRPGEVPRPQRSGRGGNTPTPGTGAFLRWHVLLGALIAQEFEAARLSAPDWTRPLRLDAEWVMTTPQQNEKQVRRSAPEWLVSRGIVISALDLGPRDLVG